MRRGLLPGSTAMTLRSSIVPWQPRMLSTWCVSKLTCSFGLVRFSSSKIHWRAAPIASGAFGSEQVLRVLKLESFCSNCCSRSSEIDSTSLTIRGSIVEAVCPTAACGIVSTASTTSTPGTRLAVARVPVCASAGRTFSTFSSFCTLPPSSDLHVLEIIAGRDASRAAERSIVKIHPGARPRAVREHDVRLRSDVETLVGIVVPVALDVVERGQHHWRVGHLVDLAP